MIDRYDLEQDLIAAEQYYDHMCAQNSDMDIWEHEAWDEIYKAEQALYDYDLNETELKDKAS